MATLVTGALGCICAWVVRGLLAGDDPWRLRMIVGPERVNPLPIIRGDIADCDRLLATAREHRVTRIIHLAAWQIPLCRQDPPGRARVNVVGTANIFEAARELRGQVERVVYASSAAVFGPPRLYGPGPVSDDAPSRPATHTTASTKSPTRRRRDSTGRSTGFPRSAFAHSRSMARGGTSASPPIPLWPWLIEAAWPAAEGRISYVEEPLPLPAALADHGYQRDLGPKPRTSLRDGIRNNPGGVRPTPEGRATGRARAGRPNGRVEACLSKTEAR